MALVRYVAAAHVAAICAISCDEIPLQKSKTRNGKITCSYHGGETVLGLK